MNTKSMCVMLVDDDKNDNFFHEREIKKASSDTIVIAKESGEEALEYLRSMSERKDIQPVLIFLDINMPKMNGWEFLEAFSKLNEENRSAVMVVMLTTSDSPENIERTKSWNFVSDYITKPLRREKMEEIQRKYFDC